MAAPLLEIRNVKKYYPVKKVRNGEDISVKAVDQIDLTVNQGEIVGLVGESGCGKSTLGKTILKLHDITGGQILFHGEDITNYTEKQMRPLREKIQIIFQDPYASLNPKKKVVQSVMTPLDVSGKYTKEEKLKKVIDILNEVGLSEKFLEKYPHEMSGGQRQRVVIAIAAACHPQILICDEPTTALDVTIQAQILNLIRDLQKELNMTVIYITHDLGVVSELCDTVIVMYNGHIVEKAPVADIFREPLHPYTQGLLSAIPRITKERKPLSTIEGMVPNPVERIKGCRFWPRCPKACDRCRKEEPPVFSVGEDRQVRCWLYAQADNGSQEAVTNG